LFLEPKNGLLEYIKLTYAKKLSKISLKLLSSNNSEGNNQAGGKKEDRRPKSEDRRRKTEVGRPETGDGRPETGDRRRKTGDRSRESHGIRSFIIFTVIVKIMRSDSEESGINNAEIFAATDEERIWAADLLSVSEPWTTLGISRALCLKNCQDPEFVVYVAHLNNIPAGFFILDLRGMAGSPYIKSIAISPEYRNRRLGSALLTFAEDIARKTSRHMFLCVSSFNLNARRFYERLGYEAVGELKDYLIKGESEIIIHKNL